MEAIGTGNTQIEIIRWMIIIVGAMLLFAGAFIYYSVIRLFGMIIGGGVGVIIALNILKGGTYSEMFTILFIIFGIVFGALIGASLTMIFHHIVLFAAGAIIGLILYKMFALGLVTPEAFKNLPPDKFIELVTPKAAIETFVMLVFGVIYLASAHLIIVVTMALVGSYLIAWAFNIYVLFPILAPIGGIIQWSISRRRRSLK